MLTTAQKAQFADALVDLGWFSDPEDAIDDITETRDTMKDFIEASGQPSDRMTTDSGLVVLSWSRKNQSLAVADFGEARAAYTA